MLRSVVVCVALLGLACAERCPDGGQCQHRHTCCNDPVSGFECCPLQQAVCCDDHVHCCPQNTVCHSATSSCSNQTVSLLWVERISADQTKMSKSFRMIKAYEGEEDENVCPDQSRCPPEFSCLRALTRFGCCPLGQGIPCLDGRHCCPGGHQCSADSRSCIKKDSVEVVLCGDGLSECPEETTCCPNSDGSWGCCPMQKAVCCEDETHCCPEGSTCDVQQSKCISSSTKKETPMWAKLPARAIASWETQGESQQVSPVQSEDSGLPEATTEGAPPPAEEEEATPPSVTAAPTGQTSPAPDSDLPEATTEGVPPPAEEEEATPPSVTTAPTGQTSPAPDSDLPEATTEGVPPPAEEEEATPPSVTTAPTGQASPAPEPQHNNVPCNDSVACKEDFTCCKTAEGDWACCPLPQAVCCEDFLHCCPHGKRCNAGTGMCDDPSTSVAWVEKEPAILWQRPQAADVPCDATHKCPDGNTCCKTSDDSWACCPLPQAVCCEDHVHCCPARTTCDPDTQTCDSPDGPLPMMEKVPASTAAAATTAAPDTIAEAVTQGAAVQGGASESEDQGEVVTGEDRPGEGGQWVSCDRNVRCRREHTCCYVASSQTWSCCPLSDAVCCPEGNRCLPKGSDCQKAMISSSVAGEEVISWYTKQTATICIDDDPRAVLCDAQHRCPEHSTCCRLLTGQWGCCPLPQAVCCEDMEHCCPQGYTCNMGTNSCQKVIYLQLDTLPLTPVYLLEHVQADSWQGRTRCDRHTSCKDQQTCCKTSASTWGCCPVPNALCCGDMKHCCPAGYSCTSAGGCSQSSGLHWESWHMYLANRRRTLLA